MAKFNVKVIPRSSRQEVKMTDSVIKVWLHAPPAEGQANEELVLILAEHFSVPKSAIKIVAGGSSRNKVVDILGINSPF